MHIVSRPPRIDGGLRGSSQSENSTVSRFITSLPGRRETQKRSSNGISPAIPRLWRTMKNTRFPEEHPNLNDDRPQNKAWEATLG